MSKRKILVAAVLIAWFGVGCDTPEQDAVRQHFKRGTARICQDETDDSRWSITWHMGNVYRVSKIPSRAEAEAGAGLH